MDHGAARVGAGVALLGMHETDPFALLEFEGEWHLTFLVVEEVIPWSPGDPWLFVGLGLTGGTIRMHLLGPTLGGSMSGFFFSWLFL